MALKSSVRNILTDWSNSLYPSFILKNSTWTLMVKLYSKCMYKCSKRLKRNHIRRKVGEFFDQKKYCNPSDKIQEKSNDRQSYCPYFSFQKEFLKIRIQNLSFIQYSSLCIWKQELHHSNRKLRMLI